MFHKIRSGLYAAWLLVTRQANLAPQHLQENREDVCCHCPIRDKQKNVCTACGCYLPIKVKLLQSSCPIGKW